MINLFKYFTYCQMLLIAALTTWFIVQCVLNGGQFHLYIMIFIVLSLFGTVSFYIHVITIIYQSFFVYIFLKTVLSTIEIFVATGGHRAVLEELVGFRMRAVEMTEWNS